MAPKKQARNNSVAGAAKSSGNGGAWAKRVLRDGPSLAPERIQEFGEALARLSAKTGARSVTIRVHTSNEWSKSFTNPPDLVDASDQAGQRVDGVGYGYDGGDRVKSARHLIKALNGLKDFSDLYALTEAFGVDWHRSDDPWAQNDIVITIPD